MTRSKDKDEGFKIPIEDAADEVAEVEADVVEEPEPEFGEPEAVEEPAEGDGVFSDAEELIAEAEAVVEEASAVEQLEKAKQEAQDWQDRYMRLHAEWDTYRRRTAEQREEEKARAAEKLVENLLPVLDDFERSVDYAEKNGEVGLLDGVRAVQSKFIDVLTKSGLVTIDPAGEPFDALEAQAVGTVPDAEAFDETVHDVYQKGYRMGTKVLRPAMVTITSGGPARPKSEDETQE